MLFQTEKEHSSALLELILKRNKKEVVTPFVSHYRCSFHDHLQYGKGAVPIIVKRLFNQSLWTMDTKGIEIAKDVSLVSIVLPSAYYSFMK